VRNVGQSLLLTLVLLIPARDAFPAADDFTGKVVGVHDGDTITVLWDRTPVKIRLFGIDCPETGQDFGSRAKGITSELAFGKVATVHPRRKDRYGRTVADVVLPDGRSLNHELVRRGLAWWYQKYAPNDASLARLEAQARVARIGLWSQPDPTPPWDWRRNGKAALPPELAGKVIGNRHSRIYHRPGCPNGAVVSPGNRVLFRSEVDAEREGFRPGRDCHHDRKAGRERALDGHQIRAETTCGTVPWAVVACASGSSSSQSRRPCRGRLARPARGDQGRHRGDGQDRLGVTASTRLRRVEAAHARSRTHGVVKSLGASRWPSSTSTDTCITRSPCESEGE
jgi:micrococcal nuclease